MTYSSKKLPEIRKEAFKNAREALGLSIQELSQMSCFSVRQIEQIENGESSSFYGPQVKFTAAKKVAGLLKLSEADAFDDSEARTPAKNQTTSAVDKDSSPSPAPVEKVEKKSAPEKAVQTQLAIEPKPIAHERAPVLASNSKTNSSQKKVFLLLSIAAALIFSVINLRPLFFPEPVKEEVVVAVVESPVENPPAPGAQDAKSTPPAPEPAPASAAPVAVASAVTAECPAADAAPVSYKPDAPKKAGDMVYLQSKNAQTVCIVDASGKTQNKALEPNVGISVYGKPPLKVLTSGQAPVDMYYQGAKVRISNTASKTIILEPAEFTQLAIPMDSQLR